MRKAFCRAEFASRNKRMGRPAEVRSLIQVVEKPIQLGFEGRTAMHSTSTRAPNASPLQPKAERAG